MNKLYSVKSVCLIILFVILSFAVPFTIPNFCSAQEKSQELLDLPAPGTLVGFTEPYQPTLVKGITIDPKNALKFEFVVNTGDSGLEGDELKRETDKLVKYFLAALTIPEKELWVNLSPYENDRIITENLSATDLGRDMLSQDYLLKQLTASIMYPKDDLGKDFWDRVYAKARELYGTTDIPLNTFNKVWIVPKSALVYEYEGTAYVIQSDLEVLLEEDYMSLQKNTPNLNTTKSSDGQNSALTSEVVRELLLPAIEKEVNEGRTFANLRQIYHAMILARWYKQALKESLLGQLYVDKNKVAGIDLADPEVKEKIYQQYIQSFAKGAFNLIKQDYDPVNQTTVLRKYFSGGIAFNQRLDRLLQSGQITSDIRRNPQNEVIQRNYTGRFTHQDKALLTGQDQNIPDVLGQASVAMATKGKTFSVGIAVEAVNPASVRQVRKPDTFFERPSTGTREMVDAASLTGRPIDRLINTARRRGIPASDIINRMPTSLTSTPENLIISTLENRPVAHDQTQISLGKLKAAAPSIPVAIKSNIDRYMVAPSTVNLGEFDAVYSRYDKTLTFNNPQNQFERITVGSLQQRTQPFRIQEVDDTRDLMRNVIAEIEKPDMRSFSTKAGPVLFDNNISEGSARAARSEIVRFLSPRIPNLENRLSAVYSAPVPRATLVMPSEPDQLPELLIPEAWNPKQLRPQQISGRIAQQQRSQGIDIVPSRQQALAQTQQEAPTRDIRPVSTPMGTVIVDRDIPERVAIQTQSAAVSQLRAQDIEAPEQKLRVATRAPVREAIFVEQKGELLIPQDWRLEDIPQRIQVRPITIISTGQEAFRVVQQSADRITTPRTITLTEGRTMTFDQDRISEPVARDVLQPTQEILQSQYNIPDQEIRNLTLSTAPIQQPTYARNEGQGRLVLPDSWNLRTAQPATIVAQLRQTSINVVDTTPQAFDALRREIDRPTPTVITTDTGSTLFYPSQIQEPIARAVTPQVQTQLRQQDIPVTDFMVVATAPVSQPTFSRQENHFYLPERWDLNRMDAYQITDLIQTQRVQIAQSDQEVFRNLARDFERPQIPRVVTTRTGPVTYDYSELRQIKQIEKPDLPQFERPEQADQAVTNILNELPQSMRSQVRAVQVRQPESRISMPERTEAIFFTDTGRLLVNPNVVTTPRNIQRNVQVMRSTDLIEPIFRTATSPRVEITDVGGWFGLLDGLNRAQAQTLLSKLDKGVDTAKFSQIKNIGETAPDVAYAVDNGLYAPLSTINNASLRDIRPVRITTAEFNTQVAMPQITKIESAENPGGIDLDPDMLDLQIKRDGKGVPLPIIQQPLDDIDIAGFVPVILDVTSMTNIPKF